MKLAASSMLIVFALGANSAIADSCPPATSPVVMSNLLNKWVRASRGTVFWNEQLVGSAAAGTVNECHKNTPADPVENNIGSYSVTVVTATGPTQNDVRISYTYGANTYVFAVCQGNGSNSNNITFIPVSANAGTGNVTGVASVTCVPW